MNKSDKDTKNRQILRLLLFCGGFGFFISVFGVFMPWAAVADQLRGLGAKNLPADPMLNYWLRMQSGANTFVGIFFFALAFNPEKYKNVLSFAWIFLIGEGCILLTWGLVLRLSPLPFVVDSLFCLIIGIGIWLSSRSFINYTGQDE